MLMEYDIVIIGGGQAGLSFACSMMETNIKILLVEKRPLELLCDPKPDGREIALTHLSVAILKKMDVWQTIPEEVISPLKEARIFDGNASSSSLNFSSDDSSHSELGYLIPNYKLCKALYKHVQSAVNVDILTDVMVEDVIRQDAFSSVTLSTGKQFNTKLVVAADSRFSTIRRKMGIPASMKDFSKVMVVSQMKLEKPHHHIALECFHYGRTVALLPMVGNHASIVMTVTADKADEIVKQSEHEFNNQITQLFNGEFGKMELEGEHYAYPLVGVYSHSLVSHRFALIGDAAVGMHPVTAHGSNLGLRGQDILADTLKEAFRVGSDIGAFNVLKRYENKQVPITRLLYFGTNSIVTLFTNDAPIAKQIRKVALKLASHFPPIKHVVTRHLTHTNRMSKLLPF
jgi:ubiquinone biosynthesis UbiH/UbiF/VisC/COQ6 family hydroxylase